MEYRMKDIMEPPKTLEEQKKEAREAAMAAGAEVLGEEWKPGTLENVKRQVENAYTDLKGCGLYKEEKHFRNGMDLMYNNVIDIINSELGGSSVEEKRCCIIHNYYVCPVCKTGYCKPFGEVKTRPIQKCRKCNKTVRMTINGK